MVDISMLTTFFGWTTTLNLAILLLATVILTSLKEVILPIHKSMLGLSEDELQNMYVQYLAQYKIETSAAKFLLPVEIRQRPVVVTELRTGDGHGADREAEILRRDLAAIGMPVFALEDQGSGTARIAFHQCPRPLELEDTAGRFIDFRIDIRTLVESAVIEAKRKSMLPLPSGSRIS